MATTSNAKDTIYLDVDDEITSIIEKVRKSQHKIVALVLPKRAVMLQSSVNMKLLKKAAKDSKKNLVLITAEKSLLPLAAASGLHVAKDLQSKPAIPKTEELLGAEAAELAISDDADVSQSDAEDFDNSAHADTPIGDLVEPEEVSPTKAKPELTPRPIPLAKPETDEAVELDNSDTSAAETTKETATKKAKKNKKLKVPNFEKFRLRLILAIALLIILIIGFIISNAALAKAVITVATKTSSINANLTLNLDTAAKVLNPTANTLPANLQQVQKTNSQQVNSSGQKNIGTQATGTVSMTATECAPNLHKPSPVPAGTGLSTKSLTFITQKDTSFSNPVPVSGSCLAYQATDVTPVTAQTGGSQYNISSATFSVSGRQGEVSATSNGAMSGGTDNVVSIVTQTDINNATQKITPPDINAVKTTLNQNLTNAGYFPLAVTYNAGTPNTTASAAVGDQASTVTVTQTVTYTMFGVKQADLQTVLDTAIDQQIDVSKQSIQDDNLSQAVYTVTSQNATSAQVSMQDTATVGPKLDLTNLKSQVIGKKTGDVKNLLSSIPDVTAVNVKYSPFWVSSVPKNTHKVTFKITKG